MHMYIYFFFLVRLSLYVCVRRLSVFSYMCIYICSCWNCGMWMS